MARPVKWNRILDDAARAEYAEVVEQMREAVPEMMARKIERANVQQAFVLDAVRHFADRDTSSILAAGAHEDTAWATLKVLGWPMHACDPVWGSALADVHRSLGGRPSYDLVFSTSVIEHVEDDLNFSSQIGDLLRPGGVAVLTMDFHPTWRQGYPKPSGCMRMYTPERIELLVEAMADCETVDEPTWHEGEIDFNYDNCRYAFATLVVRKGNTTGR